MTLRYRGVLATWGVMRRFKDLLSNFFWIRWTDLGIICRASEKGGQGLILQRGPWESGPKGLLSFQSYLPIVWLIIIVMWLCNSLCLTVRHAVARRTHLHTCIFGIHLNLLFIILAQMPKWSSLSVFPRRSTSMIDFLLLLPVAKRQCHVLNAILIYFPLKRKKNHICFCKYHDQFNLEVPCLSA